jgi:hypothetical protein
MKKLMFGMLFLSALFTLYAGGGKEKPAPPGRQSGAAQPAPAVPPPPPAPPPNPFYTGDGGKGMSLAILAPEAAGLAENQKYLPSLVQGELVSNFSGYSAIAVLDRVNLDAQYGELLSGYYDDNAEAGTDLGRLTPTEYIMGGSITKTATGYALQIRITKTADKMTAASYSGTCTFAELDNLSGIRQASLDLLQKMGVSPTERTRTELAGAAAQNHVSAQTSLAKGITAQKGGTVVQALSYYYEAAGGDPGLTEAASRLSALSASVKSGNIREDVKNDIQARNAWLATLTEAEDFYRDKYYVEILYDPELETGAIDYTKETMELRCRIFARPSAGAYNMIKVLQNLRDGLWAQGKEKLVSWSTTDVNDSGSNNARVRGFYLPHWPFRGVKFVKTDRGDLSNFLGMPLGGRAYRPMVARLSLSNDKGKILGVSNVFLTNYYIYFSPGISSFPAELGIGQRNFERRDAIFPNIPVNDITDQLSVTVTHIGIHKHDRSDDEVIENYSIISIDRAAGREVSVFPSKLTYEK